jgi:hypothetical protein
VDSVSSESSKKKSGYQVSATANSNGTISIQFVTVKDNAQVNGIEISPA